MNSTENKYIAIVGGDLRQKYLADILTKVNLPLKCLNIIPNQSQVIQAVNLEEILESCTVIICPVPITNDQIHILSTEHNYDNELLIENLRQGLNKSHILIGGKLPPCLKEYCYDHKISHYDLLDNESFCIYNAIATAEGAIMEAINLSPLNIHQSKCMVLGFGRCGNAIADRLKGFHADVCILVQNDVEAARAYSLGYTVCYGNELNSNLTDSQFIFNTVPAVILKKANLKYVNNNAVIIDIASAPGGIEYQYINDFGIKVKLCPSIPGKISPLSSAVAIYQQVEKIIKERTDFFKLTSLVECAGAHNQQI